jgi:hypothetical protein
MLKPKPITPTEEARLRECLELDPNSPSGLTWKVRLSSSAGAGDPAGSLRTEKNGHQTWRVNIDRRTYGAHNIVWLFLYGQWPAEKWPLTVDHINRNGSDNSHDNLRLATQSQQISNQRVIGASSYKFVCWCKQNQKWKAHWRHPVTKKTINVGLFTDELQAHRAALASRLESYSLLTGEWL